MTTTRTWKHWFVVMCGFTVAASLTAAWLGGGMSRTGVVGSFVYTACIGCLCSGAGHLCWPPLERFPRPVRWLGRVVSMGMAVALGTLLALAVLTSAGQLRTRDFWTTYRMNLQFAAFLTVTAGGGLMAYEYWRSKYEHAELERERALKLATEARLASLESRIHPHFLFNTLNSISSLIHSDPMAADAQLQRLCVLLRFSLDASETPLVTLGKELQIVQDYLEIEKTRFGDRLRYELDAADSALGCSVPPLSVQTLVENSVKHVIAPSRTGGTITIRATVADGVLTVAVHDGGPGVAAVAVVPGHGLDNLRSRLDVLFADRARLAFAKAAVRLEVPA